MAASSPPARDLSIVIVTYNSRAVIEPCLASIAAAAGRLAVAVTVVDNASTDGTPDLLADRAELTLVRNQKNLGFAAACNIGIRLGRERAVLLLNPDTIATPTAFERLVAGLDRSPAVGLAGPTIVNQMNGTPRPPVSAAPTLGWLFRRFTAARYLPHRRSTPAWRAAAETPLGAGYLNGACLLVRREMFEQIGGLDEGYFMYWEDMEYSRRALARGWKLLWTSPATVYHARARGSADVDPWFRHWLGLVGARRYFTQPEATMTFPVVWQLFKLLHLATVVMTCVESGAKACVHTIAGNRERSERHRRRWRDASAFLRTYAGKLLRL